MAKPLKKKQANAKKTFVLQKLDFRWPLLIAVISIGLYINTLHHDYVLDDAVAILQNQFVQQGVDGIGGILTVDFWHFSNITLGYYRPLGLITFAIEHQFFGNNPHVTHLVNILLYAFTGFMLCLLLMELFSGYKKIFAFLICLLFIAHPVHTEVVANLKSRDEILSFLGIISMLFIMFRYDGSRKRTHLIISLVIYYLAMLSKETAITGAALLPAILYFFRQKSIGESILKTIPFVLVVLLFYFQKYEILGNPTEKSFFELNNYPYIHEKFTSSMIIFLYCVKLLFFPHPLIYDYAYNQIPAGSWTNPLTLTGFLLFGFLLYLTVKSFFQKKIWGLALAVFFITLLPALAFVWLRGGIMAERFLYAPTLGFSIALVYFLALLLKVNLKKTDLKLSQPVAASQTPVTVQSNSLGDKMWVATACIIFVAYSFKTVDRNKAWKDNMTLFSTDIEYAYKSCQNNRQLGHELLERAIAEKDSARRMDGFHKSLDYLRKAAEINPHFGEVYGDLGREYYDIKFTPDSAIYYFRRAIDATPNAFDDYSNLGLVYTTLQKYKLASFYFNMAVAINPRLVGAQQNADQLKKSGIDIREYPGGEDPSLSIWQLPVLTVPSRNPQ